MNQVQGPKPKALVYRTIPEDIKSRLERLLCVHKRVSVNSLPFVYAMTYDETLDATKCGFAEGLYELLDRSNYMIQINNGVCSLTEEFDRRACMADQAFDFEEDDKSTPIDFVTFVRRFHLRRRYKDFFSPGNFYLWHNHLKILSTKPNDITIPRSPYEKALIENHQKMSKFADFVHACLSKHPRGLPLIQLYLHIPFDKRFLNQTSVENVVLSYPEIFHCYDEENEEGLLMVYDGRTTTFEDLSGNDLTTYTSINPYKIAACAILTGVYQMTLMLIKKAHNDGLKVCVWMESLRINFGNLPEKFQKMLDKIDPLVFFLAMQFVGLVSVKSHKYSKNDLRAYLPPHRFSCEEILNKAKRTECCDS